MTKTVIPLSEKIAVMQAFEAHKPVQRQDNYGTSPWVDDPSPNWDWDNNTFRVKPGPREWWLNEYNDGHDGMLWRTKQAAEQSRDVCRTFLRLTRVREVL